MRRMHSYFTLGEYWMHFWLWARSFPRPWRIFEHMWVGPVDGDTRACLLCDRRIDVGELNRLEDGIGDPDEIS